jgi:uncharacterized membrane protein
MRNVALVLAILAGTFGIARACGRTSHEAGRTAIAAVFCFTALGHFAKPNEMQDMLPPWVPARKAVIWMSGLLELALAAGILRASTSRPASIAAIVFLFAAAPLNIYSACQRVRFGGHGAGPKYLFVRLPLQALLMAWTWWFGVHAPSTPSVLG